MNKQVTVNGKVFKVGDVIQRDGQEDITITEIGGNYVLCKYINNDTTDGHPLAIGRLTSWKVKPKNAVETQENSEKYTKEQ